MPLRTSPGLPTEAIQQRRRPDVSSDRLRSLVQGPMLSCQAEICSDTDHFDPAFVGVMPGRSTAERYIITPPFTSMRCPLT
jgi:hypothetical protein